MLEEICRLRATLGRVVFLWVPSHVGISPNSMADAVAKTYLTQPPDAAGVARIAAAVRTRPCFYTAFPTPNQLGQIGAPPERPNMVFLAKSKKTQTAMLAWDRLLPVPAPSTLYFTH